MFVQANVKNTSASTLAGMSASFGGFTSTAIALAPGETTYRYIGSLAPNASAALFWYVNYTCTIGIASNYTVSVADSQPGIVSSGLLTMTTRFGDFGQRRRPCRFGPARPGRGRWADRARTPSPTASAIPRPAPMP